MGAGTTKITAASDDGGYVDNITITVKGNGKELTGLSLNESALTLKPEQTATLTAVLQPEQAQASLSWKTSDESIVRVSGNEGTAIVTAVNPGSAEVTVSSSDGKFSASCKVTVSVSGSSDKNHPSISFAQTSMNLTVGQTQSINLSVSPSGAEIGKVNWSSSSELITLKDGYSATEVIVTAAKAGQATLTATTADGLTASCTITVQEEGSSTNNKVKLSINQLVLNAGEEAQLQYMVDPVGTDLVWSSNNPRIADVDQKGYVTSIVTLDQTTEVTITATNLTTGEYQTKVVEVSVTGSGWGYGTTGDPVPDEDNDQRN